MSAIEFYLYSCHELMLYLYTLMHKVPKKKAIINMMIVLAKRVRKILGILNEIKIP